MRQKIAIIISLLGITLLPVFTYAANGTGTATTTNTTKAAAQQAQQTQRFTSLQSRGEQEITRRLTALNTLITKVNGLARLTAAEKASFVSQIQSNIDELTALNTKIAADTDVTTLLADVQSIVSAYRIFLVFMPQVNLLAAADRVNTTVSSLTTLSTNLSNRLTAAQASGKNVTALETTLSDMNAKLADATTQSNEIQTSVTPLTPAGYPGNKTTLVAARADLKTARTDLQTAFQDAKTIISGVEAL
jgi:hypothetical protein